MNKRSVLQWIDGKIKKNDKKCNFWLEHLNKGLTSQSIQVKNMTQSFSTLHQFCISCYLCLSEAGISIPHMALCLLAINCLNIHVSSVFIRILSDFKDLPNSEN